VNSYKEVTVNPTQYAFVTYKNDSSGLLKMCNVCNKKHSEIHNIQNANLVMPVDISVRIEQNI